MLKASNLHKQLGSRSLLRGVDLECAAGNTVFVEGPNGSGKSTLLRVLSGLLLPDRGDIEICGISSKRDPAATKACLGYVPDGLEPLPDLLVSEFLSLVCALKTRPRGGPVSVDAAQSEALGVSSLAAQRLASLSFGQRKRVMLLAALAGAPRLLLVDEPTNGLDPSGVIAIQQLVAERRRRALATVLASNDVEFMASIEGHHYLLESGRLTLIDRAGS